MQFSVDGRGYGVVLSLPGDALRVPSFYFSLAYAIFHLSRISGPMYY